MKKMYVLGCFLAMSATLAAQNFSVVGDTANLGTVYENAADSVLIQLVNTGSFPVEIDRIVGFPFYGDTVVLGKPSNSTRDLISSWMKV